jgi:hypothetical protein
MMADFATKPLQGAMFKRFRDMIMGVVPSEDPETTKLKTTKPANSESVSRPRKAKKDLVTA